MEQMDEGKSQHLVADTVSFARSYQLEALEKALNQNTLVYFETGTGKTLIAVMLLRSFAHLLKKPSPYVAVFLVPTVVLVTQQSATVSRHTDLKVGIYYGELGLDYWNATKWKEEVQGNEVLVMTPQILLNCLRHKFICLNQIKVLIFDECHNAKGNHPYACIMKEFYHRELAKSQQVPRVFGMTASPIKAKVQLSSEAYWEQIRELEKLMYSKVFTCASDAVIAQYVPSSTPKLKVYNRTDIPHTTLQRLEDNIKELATQHCQSLETLHSAALGSLTTKKRLNKLWCTFTYSLRELGVWPAMKAAEAYSRKEDAFSWGRMDSSAEQIIRTFSLGAVQACSKVLPSDANWSIAQDLGANLSAGYLTSKVISLIEILVEYRNIHDLRCIIFVQRIATAIVISSLLNELLTKVCGWRAEYTAGNTSRVQPQSRKEQNTIIENFRNGKVNIIVSTSMLEEGLDVQSCNLVIRFDPSATICSFIQSRGRARMQNSDFVLMVQRGDTSALDLVNNYLCGGDMMRRECVRHFDVPCEPIDNQLPMEDVYVVESTGAIVTFSSCVMLLHFYCSRLPSDSYFKPHPQFTIDKELGTCILRLPNSCPIQIVTASGRPKFLKQIVCLEACKKLHRAGALTDNLVPDIVEEEMEAQEQGHVQYVDEHSKYFPPELIGNFGNTSEKVFQCYLLELNSDWQYDVEFRDIVLAVHTRLPVDLEEMNLEFDVDRGKLSVQLKYVGYVSMNSDLVSTCQIFQISILRVLLDRSLEKLREEIENFANRNDSTSFDYLLLPAEKINQKPSIDWKSIYAVRYPQNTMWDEHTRCFSTWGHNHYKNTRNGLACRCYLENSLVLTPHNGYVYCTTGTLAINGNSYLELETGGRITYKNYYEKRHGIKLRFDQENLLNAKRVFSVNNCLHRGLVSSRRALASTHNTYELPPEICSIIMSPISASTFYSFSFLPSIMHRIESLIMAANLKCMHTGQVVVPTLTVLEAVTTKKCQETIHLESLETLGDSFLKYAASQHLFKTFQNRHEGLLTAKRERIICNNTLCMLGCEHKITGFIRNEPFDPQTWVIPGTNCADIILGEDQVSSKIFYEGKKRKIKSKTVADVAEALIGAYLSAGGESAALSFMAWLGVEIDLFSVPYTRNFAVTPERHVNVQTIQSILNYNFRDPSLLVEALTHGSYMLPEIPGCYQRLEFLGDAVLDYLITQHLYFKHTGLSPGFLTDLRSASVNNECYALSSIKAGLHKHVLHLSQSLYGQIAHAVHKFEEAPLASTFGWESETAFPKVLGDVIESLAGAIYVDSGYNKDVVFQSMRPLLEPLVTPETMKLHPIRELTELCQKMDYILNKPTVASENGLMYATVEVEANGVVHKRTMSEADKKMATKLAYREVLKALKESIRMN